MNRFCVIGIVTLVIASAEAQKATDVALITAMIVIIMLINLGVLFLSGRISKYLSHEIVELMERVLGILLGALAVELILTGLSDLGIITMVTH